MSVKLFNVGIYRKFNDDLNHMNDYELHKHFMECGINENRIYYELDNINELSLKIYKLYNDDLCNFNDEELLKHYYLHGVNENRICSVKSFMEYYGINNGNNYHDEELILNWHKVNFQNTASSNIMNTCIVNFQNDNIKNVFNFLSNVKCNVCIYNYSDINNINNISSNNINILYSENNINDSYFNNDYYLNLYDIPNGVEHYATYGINENRNKQFGNINLFLFDVIYAPNIETYNYELNNRFISSAEYSLDDLHNKTQQLLNLNNDFYVNYNSKINNLHKICFILPTIGRLTLYNAIDSLFKQTKHNWFAIIAFDEIQQINNCEKFKTHYNSDKLIFININTRVINNNNGHGRASAIRAESIKYLQRNEIYFDWIGFLDDDDTLNERYIEQTENEIFLNKYAKTIIFRMFYRGVILPRINDYTFIKDNVGISFIVHKDIINDGINFKYSSTEDFDMLNDIRESNAIIVISPYLYYNVNGIQKYTNHKFARIVINDTTYTNRMLLNNDINFYVINLDDKKQKYVSINQEILKFNNSKIERFNAIKPTIDDVLNCKFININKLWKFKTLDDICDLKYCIGASGCKMSHYALLKQIYENNNNCKYHLILEDDCVFRNNSPECLINTLTYIEENNIDFNILYLSCNLHTDDSFEVINENLLYCNLKHGHTTHAMLFKKKNIPEILNFIENSEAEIDNVYTELPNRYIVYPMIAYQRNDVSDISCYREFTKGGLMDNKTYTDSIFYGYFDKKIFIKQKVDNFVNKSKL